MTSRAVIAVAVPAVPLLAGLAIAGIPGRRAAERLALASAVPTAVLAVVTGVWALSTPGSPLRGDWLCVDAAGGALVGVIGIVGAASVALSPTYLAHARTSLFGETRPPATTTPRCCSSGPRSWPCPWPRTSVPPGC